jgi:hypothetical protein
MVALERAESVAIPVRVVASEDDLMAARVTLPPSAMVNLRADLAEGYVALVPAGMPAGEEMTGWWRIEPRTGETLGMTSDGRGQVFVDYIVIPAVSGIIMAASCWKVGEDLGAGEQYLWALARACGFATFFGIAFGGVAIPGVLISLLPIIIDAPGIR